VFLLGLGALFMINGFVIGWSDAYDVTVQITSPLDTAQRWVAMPLSLAGWLVWPSVTGSRRRLRPGRPDYLTSPAGTKVMATFEYFVCDPEFCDNGGR
jgi:hypothetical protein